MDKIGIVVCLHGDESMGLEIKKKLGVNMPTFIANPVAVKKNVRFIEADMNRSFPGKIDGKHEEKEAYYLLDKLKKFKYIVDIHSSSCKIELFAIITKPTKEKLRLASKLGIKKGVIMNDRFANGSSLIDNLNCAISLEVGPHERKENISEVIQAIKNLDESLDDDFSASDLEIFEIFDIIYGDNISKYDIENFRKVKKGEVIAEGEKKYYAPFDFIPVFVGEKAYNGIICMATKKVD
jgi:succinylglutamate desuccinylase